MGYPDEVVSVGWDKITTQKPDDDSRTYREEFKSDMVISCADLPAAWGGATASERFDALLDAEAGCSVFRVSVEVFCADAWTEVWTGTFDTNWKSDRIQKTITVRPKATNPFECLKKAWTEQQNVFGVTPVVRTNPYNASLKFETYVENPCDPSDPPTPLPDPNYCYSGQVSVLDFTYSFKCGWIFQRYEKAGTCSGATPVPPDDFTDWNLVLPNPCPGTNPTYWSCPEGARVVHKFPNGRRFDAVLEYLMEQTECGLTVVSNFFNINPDDTAPDNSFYDRAADVLQDLILHQASDVKRFDASDPSKIQAWNIKLQDLLNDLKILFNMDWKVDGPSFRLEHVSYFEAQTGPDYTAESYKRELSRADQTIYRLTRFLFKNEQAGDYFKGFPIEVYCGEGEQTKRLSVLSTDLAFISNIDNAESIADDGFVLVATTPSGFTNIYENLFDNRPLSWTELHRDFYTAEMDGSGEINGIEVTPYSLKKTRKAPAFGVRLCCDDDYNPSALVTTAMGNGEVAESERDWGKDLLTLTLKYT